MTQIRLSTSKGNIVVALNEELMQDDGIHPTRDAQPLIMERIYRQLKPIL